MFNQGDNNQLVYDNGSKKIVVCDFYPAVEAIEEIHDGSVGAVVYRFRVSVAYNDRISRFTVQDLEKIDFFKACRVPSHNLKGKKRDMVIQKLQEDAASCEPEIIYEVGLGFHLLESQPVYNFAGLIIAPSSCGLTIRSKIKTSIEVNVQMLRDPYVLVCRASDFSVYTPNASIIVFYFLVLTVLKPILNKYPVNFIPFVTAPHGHGKTVMIMKMLFIGLDRKISFSSTKNRIYREKMLRDNCGLAILADDLKPLQNYEKKQLQEDRLDDYARWISSPEADYASLVITGEYVSGLSSCIDRLLIIEIDRIAETVKQQRKAAADAVPDTLFPTLAYYICRVVIDNYAQLMQDIDDFMNRPTEIISDGAPKRFYEYIKMFRMAEHIFRKYFTNGDEGISHRAELETAIAKITKSQALLLDKLDEQESLSDRDFIIDFFEAFGKAISSGRTTKDSDAFVTKKYWAYVANDRIWTSENGIANMLKSHLGFTVCHDYVVKALQEQYLLLHDEGRRKKKLGSKYFFCIDLPRLVEYGEKCGVSGKELENSALIVPKYVHR